MTSMIEQWWEVINMGFGKHQMAAYRTCIQTLIYLLTPNYSIIRFLTPNFHWILYSRPSFTSAQPWNGKSGCWISRQCRRPSAMWNRWSAVSVLPVYCRVARPKLIIGRNCCSKISSETDERERLWTFTAGTARVSGTIRLIRKHFPCQRPRITAALHVLLTW